MVDEKVKEEVNSIVLTDIDNDNDIEIVEVIPAE